MIFPTADEPFGYPNQPLTTFENNQQFAKNDPYTTAQPFSGIEAPNLMTPRPASRGRDDNMEAQFFALPPFIDQQQQQLNQHQHQGRAQTLGFPPNGMPYTNGQPMSAQAAHADAERWYELDVAAATAAEPGFRQYQYR